MKSIGHFLLVTTEIAVGVTVGAFVAGYMFEAGKDAYRQDKMEVVKETVKEKATSWKDKFVGILKEVKK